MKTLNAQAPLLQDNFVRFDIKNKTYVFRRIAGYHGYFASTCGQVISLVSANTTANKKPDWSNPQLLTGKDNGNGYLQVRLYSANGYSKWHLVHRLVALTHLDKPMSHLEIGRLQVNHLNKNRQDNHVRNLAWTTPTENLHWNALVATADKERCHA